jgi:ABC-type antimicrobial peptide transport system permease subunit
LIVYHSGDEAEALQGTLDLMILQSLATLGPLHALPLFGARSLDDLIAQASVQPRFNAGLMGAFACAALLLAAVGIHGMTAYTVSRRRREFRLRMALGARPSEVLGLVMRAGAKLTVLGLVMGGMVALAVTRVLSNLLHGVRPPDPFTLATTALILCSVGLFACWLPARRTTRIDPAVTLRED